jgi:chemotaxis receptor (MCP) glutamine deamidase CheD
MIKAKLYMNVHWIRSRHFEFHIGTKNVQFVEDHLMNIHVQGNPRWPPPQDID